MIWLEIHCELRCNENTHEGCFSNRDDWTPEASSDDNVDNVKKTLECLSEDARKVGWRKIEKIGWVCPPCLEGS